MVLGSTSDHAGAANINLLDGLVRGDALPGNGGFEGIQVDDHQINGLDALDLGIGHMVRQIATEEQSAMDARVQGLDPAIEALRRPGVGGHLHGLQPGLLKGPQAAACGEEPPTLGQEALGQGNKPDLVVHRDQCRWHGFPRTLDFSTVSGCLEGREVRF